MAAGDNSQIWRQSPYRGTVSVFRRQVMSKNSYIPQKLDVPRLGDCLPFWRLNMSPIRGTFSQSGDSMEKCNILGIFRLSCAFYYEKAHVKTSWEDASPSRPKFNLLHQRNPPLRLVQRCGTDTGIVTRLKTWKNCLFSL